MDCVNITEKKKKQLTSRKMHSHQLGEQYNVFHLFSFRNQFQFQFCIQYSIWHIRWHALAICAINLIWFCLCRCMAASTRCTMPYFAFECIFPGRENKQTKEIILNFQLNEMDYYYRHIHRSCRDCERKQTVALWWRQVSLQNRPSTYIGGTKIGQQVNACSCAGVRREICRHQPSTRLLCLYAIKWQIPSMPLIGLEPARVVYYMHEHARMRMTWCHAWIYHIYAHAKIGTKLKMANVEKWKKKKKKWRKKYMRICLWSISWSTARACASKKNSHETGMEKI